jgi:hypothetical protein
MAKGTHRENDNQRDKSAKKKVTPAAPANAHEADASTDAPSRVHIFKGIEAGADKSPTGNRNRQK